MQADEFILESVDIGKVTKLTIGHDNRWAAPEHHRIEDVLGRELRRQPV
jgi:hypothetical protein